MATVGQQLFSAITVRSPGIDVDAFGKIFYPTLAEFISEGKMDIITEDTYRAIDLLRQHGSRVMILTSRCYEECRHLLDSNHKLSSRIDAFYYKEVTAFHKPDKRVFDELLREHSIQPSQCIYVGDSISDAVAAKGAGMYFIASLESGFKSERDFDEVNVDTFIKKFTDLPNAVKALEQSRQQEKYTS
jgi:HAD superfamily hydrolase (TIGR01662 family)